MHQKSQDSVLHMPKLDMTRTMVSTMIMLLTSQIKNCRFSRRLINFLLVRHLLENATALLPHQGILENFIHHNPLKHFESMTWKDAMEHIRHIESYKSPVRSLSV